MLLDSRFKSAQRSLCCFTVGLISFSTAFSAQQIVGQQIQTQPIQPAQSPQVLVQQPTVGPQTRIYQSPIIRGPIYQGPDYFPQQTPIVNPVIQDQGTTQTVPPVAQRIRQADQPNRRQLDQAAAKAALDAEKIAVLEKLLEKYKAIAANGQGSPAELTALRQKNTELLEAVESQRQLTEKNALAQTGRISELSKLTEQMRAQYAESETKVQTLEKQLAAAGTQDSTGMQEVEKLKAQVSGLDTKLQTLTSENKSYAEQLAESKTALANAMQAQPDQNEKVELMQQVRELNNTNLGLTQKQDAMRQSRDELNEKLSKLEAEYQELERQRQQTMVDNQKLESRIAELSTGNQNSVSDIALVNDSPPAQVQTTSFAQPAVDVSSYESKISLLNRKNRQLADSNADFKSENRSLSRQLASLKQQATQTTASDTSATLASAQAPAAAAVGLASEAIDEKRGWGVLGWLIPFLAIGLGVAFFVILREEFQRPLAGAGDRDSRKN